MGNRICTCHIKKSLGWFIPLDRAQTSRGGDPPRVVIVCVPPKVLFGDSRATRLNDQEIAASGKARTGVLYRLTHPRPCPAQRTALR